MSAAPEVLARLAAAVPANVRAVCEKLSAGGFQTVTVGGAVRDALLGRDPGDWDVATAAPPEEVMARFPRTVPTGLQHGTVTVVTGRGEESHVEVTTFRGEGAYSDARRPDHVTFGVPIVEDLARRDLVVNAMAYDPAADVLHDPFGGLADLAARRLRAVGHGTDQRAIAVARFSEDGLRVMRAVRFAAVLEFDLDAETERGIGDSVVLASLARVSRERVSDELRKLLAARQPSRGLAIARRTGIIGSVLPVLAVAIAPAADAWLARVDAASAGARLGALLADLSVAGGTRLERGVAGRVETLLRALKFSNEEELGVAGKLVGAARPAVPGDPGLRRLLADVGRPVAPLAADLWRASGDVALASRAEAILARGDALAVSELAVGGTDLMSALGLPAGPALGKLLAALFDQVLADPAVNTREGLLAAARALSSKDA